jgi:hypothetical protein
MHIYVFLHIGTSDVEEAAAVEEQPEEDTITMDDGESNADSQPSQENQQVDSYSSDSDDY